MPEKYKLVKKDIPPNLRDVQRAVKDSDTHKLVKRQQEVKVIQDVKERKTKKQKAKKE